MADDKEKHPSIHSIPIVTPFFRSPFTDLGGAMVNAQHYDKCGPMELKMMECLEAYGLDRGKTKCADIIDDFYECYTMRKQQLRTFVSSHRAHQMTIDPLRFRFRPCDWSVTSNGSTES